MTFAISTKLAIEELGRDPLRHVVLLKQLLAHPDHVKAYRASDDGKCVILLALEAAASAYDRQTYPDAEIVAFISSDHLDLTASLLPCLPCDVGIVFKLSDEADLIPIESKFSVERRTAFVSFTAAGGVESDAGVCVTTAPGDATFQMFETQGHEQPWIRSMLESDRAFACVLEEGGDTGSVCLVYENWGPVWEVGGVVTAPAHRRKAAASNSAAALMAATPIAAGANARIVPPPEAAAPA